MKRLFAAVLIAAATGAPALAQTEPLRIAPPSSSATPRAAPSAAPAAPSAQSQDRIVLTPETCARILVEHQPAPDVAYRPGVDVYGRPVAPADLPSLGGSLLGQQTTTDLILNPRGGSTFPPIRGVRGETYVGAVTVTAEGSVLLNGQPIDGTGQSDLARFCRQAYP
jgi:hypothetical protein